MSKILEKIFEIAQATPHKIALIGEKKIDEKLINEEISFHDLARQIKLCSASLQKSQYQKIALIADNSPSWIIFDLACLLAKITLIPLPHFFTKEQIESALKLENIEAVFCDNLGFTKMLLPQNYEEKSTLENVTNFHVFVADIKNKSLAKDEIAKITFTSGSTGNPKGIALSSNSIDAVVFSLLQKIGAKNLQKNLSILPLAILLENIAGVYLSLVSGTIAIIPNLALVGIKNSSGLDIEAFSEALARHNPSSFITPPELAKLLILLVKNKKISAQNFKFIAVGGARIAKDLLDEARQLHIPLYQGYGLSECCSVVALNVIGENKNGSVGKILPHLQVKIADDGEILIKGQSLASGVAVDKEGYYASGDIGFFDEENFLYISGRKKNIFITSMMRNVNPEWVESELLKSYLIAQVAVFGEAMIENIAVIFPSNATVTKEIIEKEVERINEHLPDYARVKKVIMANEPFTSANGLLTGNGRLKRTAIQQKYLS